jgi:hypothetical protein
MVRQGLATADDFRFLRAIWEVSIDSTTLTHSWLPFAKGGEFSEYYSAIHLYVDWRHDHQIYMSILNPNTGQPKSNIGMLLSTISKFLHRPGLTYSRRSQKGFSVRALPSGSLFADIGPSIFPTGGDGGYLLGLMNSSLLRLLLSALVSFGKYEVGAVQKLPFIDPPLGLRETVTRAALRCHEIYREGGSVDELTHAFESPALLQSQSENLVSRMEGRLRLAYDQYAEASSIGNSIDVAVLDLYGITSEDRVMLGEELRPHIGSYLDDTTCLDVGRFRQAYLNKEEFVDEEHEEAVSGENPGTKPKRIRSRYRSVQDLAHLFRVHPAAIARCRTELGLIRPDELAEEVENLLSYCFGVVFGRWDVRVGKRPEWATLQGGAFDPLPLCSPGMLTEDAALACVSKPLPYRRDRLPAGQEHVPTEYPIAVQWSGIVADDPEHPRDDVLRRVRAVFAYLFERCAEGIEVEACEILRVRGLREYLQRPALFFSHHLEQYSKSRRQAPIYWPLSTASGSYTLWIYYHRLTSDTLFTAVNQYVLPKLAAVERELPELGLRLDGASGREATRLREETERVQAFRDELVAFRDELLRVAALPYRPDLNDGVIINAAPLHRLFRLPKWAKDTKECWTKLERGDYDWAHLAYTIWPERVRGKCRTDKSLAIAHGLEELYVEPPAVAKKRGGRAAPVPAMLDEDDE